MTTSLRIPRRSLLAGAAATPLVVSGARAQAKPIKIGVLTDMSGPYRDFGGLTSEAAAKLAAGEFAGKGFTVEVIAADHQNKADLGAQIARQWFDRDGVDVIVDTPNSGVALAVSAVAKEKNKIFLACGPATTDLTGAQCTANTLHWSYDTYMLARSTGGATVRVGGDSWYFLTADYAFGQQLQKDTTNFVTRNGGKVLGASPYPFPGTTDFSSFLVTAASSGAKVLGLANAGTDTTNSIKQAVEFGLTRKMQIAALLMVINDVHAIGQDAAQGLRLTESFYWDLNDSTRAWTKRIVALTPKNYPNMCHAGVYSSVLHYLKAVSVLGAAAAQASGADTVAKMKATPTEDDCFGKGSIRADGRTLFPAYLFEVKKPSESKGEWDLYKLQATTPADEAWRPLSDNACALVKA